MKIKKIADADLMSPEVRAFIDRAKAESPVPEAADGYALGALGTAVSLMIDNLRDSLNEYVSHVSPSTRNLGAADLAESIRMLRGSAEQE